MGLFKKKPGSVPNRAASPNRRPVQSADAWLSSLPQSSASKAHSASIDKKIAQNAWESNNMKVRNTQNEGIKAKSDAAYTQSQSAKKKFQGGDKWTEHGFSSERM